MARAKIEAVHKVTLELSAREALWLHGMSQNSLLEDEPAEHAEAREGIFSALAAAQIITKLESDNGDV